MTNIDGLPLTAAEAAIEAAHPGFHVWHSRDEDGHPACINATVLESDLGGSGTTLSAPSVERIEEVIGTWEHEHGRAAA